MKIESEVQQINIDDKMPISFKYIDMPGGVSEGGVEFNINNDPNLTFVIDIKELAAAVYALEMVNDIL